MNHDWMYEIVGYVTDENIHRMFEDVEAEIYDHVDPAVEPTLTSHDLRYLNEWLGSIDVVRLPVEFIIGIPRSTYPLRGLLTNWKPLVSRAHDELERRDRDAGKLLRGLL